MDAVHNAVRQQSLSNSEAMQKKIYQWAEEYSEADKVSKEMNEARAAIREKVKEAGIPTDAFLDRYRYYKKNRHQQEGFDDGIRICDEALSKAKNGELFKWMEKPAKPEKAPKEKKAKKEKPIGVQQAETYGKAHATA